MASLALVVVVRVVQVTWVLVLTMVIYSQEVTWSSGDLNDSYVDKERS